MKTRSCFSDALWLASRSPRRRALLNWLGVDFRPTPADVDETPYPGEAPARMVMRLARAKAQAADGAGDGAWILAADTVVAVGDKPLGKPRDATEARAMLERLRHDHHAVHTGVTLYHPTSGERLARRVTTQVWMRPYSDAEMERYIASGDPFDKAGAYAIQHPDFDPVARLDRCYANVVGLPLCAVVALLRQAGGDLALDSQHPDCSMRDPRRSMRDPRCSVRDLCRNRFDYDCPKVDEGTRL
jgi:MAF protein